MSSGKSSSCITKLNTDTMNVLNTMLFKKSPRCLCAQLCTRFVNFSRGLTHDILPAPGPTQ